jgi:hypothetical protein
MPGTYDDIMHDAVNHVSSRGVEYGDIDMNFRRASVIASTVLNREVSKYEIAIILDAVKQARSVASPFKMDHYIDGINYRAFAAMFAAEIKEEVDKKNKEEEDRAEQERIVAAERFSTFKKPAGLPKLSELPDELVRNAAPGTVIPVDPASIP